VASDQPGAYETLTIDTDNYVDELFIRARVRLDQSMDAGAKFMRIFYFEGGVPLQRMGILQAPDAGRAPLLQGAKCPECGSLTLIRRDGCDWRTACGYVGVCG
jgi:hypothetical protein